MRILRSRHIELRPRRGDERGQAIVLFAFVLLGIVAMAGLLIDGGLAWSNRRQAQAAADTAALAAAKAIVDGESADFAARLIAQLNGFLTNLDCNGNVLANGGVTVNNPPVSANNPIYNGDPKYVEVITTRAMHTTFSGALGVTCFMVSARALAEASVVTGVAQCSFCSLNSSSSNHTLVLKNGARLRVDGDIIVNSVNGGYTPGTCVRSGLYKVCGDGFDIFGAGGNITAQRISVHGGWETHDLNIARADGPAPGCVDNVNPLAYSGANVCIHMPLIADPFNDPAFPGNVLVDPPPVPNPPAAGLGCQLPGAPGTTLAITAGSATLCPGLYDGGILIGGSANVTMLGGVYYIGGGGFTVSGGASVDGTAGVMIYNGIGGAGGSSSTDPALIDLLPDADPSLITPVLAQLPGTALDGLASSADPSNPGQTVTFYFTICGNTSCSGVPPTGTMTFFDGATPICLDQPVSSFGGSKVFASCPVTFSTWGTRAISAIYCPPSWTPCDATTLEQAHVVDPLDIYNPIGSALTQTITAPTNTPLAPIAITTSGAVRLYGPTSGAYSGLTIFQTRASSATITLSPGGSVGACNGSWMSIGVPDGDPPPACGAIGGLRGTIYAGNQNALVYITASGLANLQVIAGKIRVDSGANARFAYTPQFFANGSIRLIE
jgi:Flp pilus assembly protein TadG